MNIKKTSYITNIEIANSEIKDIRLLHGKKKTLDEWYKETKADVICNGALFNNDKAGTPIESYITDGKVLSTSSWCRQGFGINYDKSIQFGEVSTNYRDFTSGFPTLVRDSKVNIFPDVAENIKAKNPRTVFSQTKNGIMLTTVDGRQPGKPGATVAELALYLKTLGVVNSVNLDGGGSTRALINGETVNHPCENRAVSNVIAVWLNKESEGDKMRKKICIDAGHNYSKFDTGAEGNGLREQDVTFIIALFASNLLKKAGFEVKLTRTAMTGNLGTDTTSSLTQRAQIANDWNADLFLSIHCNAFTSSAAHGTGCYIYKRNNSAEPIAEKICKNISQALGVVNRGVTASPGLAVLRKTNMPAVLIETAFISNPEDAAKLKYNQEDFATVIANSVCEHYGVPQITPSKNQYSYHDTVEAMVQDGIILKDANLWANIKAWEEMFDKHAPLNVEYVKTILERYHKKLQKE